MEIGDVKKVASRKRMSSEVDKLREKVSRETAKIIKLKVAQDTAYWDLKEKLQQVENNHERLQQNMVEVQMQHETISGQYQEELRRRPETLNKLASTREICDVLEDYCGRLKETLTRCKADQSALCDAYHKSGQLVRDMKAKQEQADEKKRQFIENLQDKVNTTNEFHGQMIQILTAAKEKAEADVDKAHRQIDQLTSTNAQLQREVDRQAGELGKKDEINNNLHQEMARALEEYNRHCSEARSAIHKLENEIRAGKEEYANLKQELSAQEELFKAVTGDRDALQGKVTTLEEARAQLINNLDELKIKLEETSKAKAAIEQSFEQIIEEKNRLEKEINDYIQGLTNTKQQLQEQEVKLNTLEKEKLEIASELLEKKQESNQKTFKINELEAKVKLLNEKINETENAFKCYRETAEAKIGDMTAESQEKSKEIESKAEAINLLMSDVKAGTDARSRLEGLVQKLRKDLEIEKESAKEKEKNARNQIEQLEKSVRDKDNELSKHMSIILETRKEKERLQEKIQNMQQTIDNVQKELTGKLPAASTVSAEMDDNAVMLTPSRQAPLSPVMPQRPEFAVPRAQPRQDSMPYQFFSDSSMEGDPVDVAEVERRFAALVRGERPPPVPLSALKRRVQEHKNPPTSHSQVNNNAQNRERTFFKSKRHETNKKKIKVKK